MNSPQGVSEKRWVGDNCHGIKCYANWGIWLLEFIGFFTPRILQNRFTGYFFKVNVVENCHNCHMVCYNRTMHVSNEMIENTNITFTNNVSTEPNKSFPCSVTVLFVLLSGYVKLIKTLLDTLLLFSSLLFKANRKSIFLKLILFH